MTPQVPKTVVATLGTAALVASGVSAYVTASQPSLAEAAVANTTTHGHVQRGAIVSVVPVAQLTAEQLTTASADFAGAPASRYGVTAYRLIYRTAEHDGQPTTASGLVILPNGKRGALTPTVYLHGTNPTKAAAATVDDNSEDRLVTALFAGQGLVGIAPDYLGLGLVPGRPQYLDSRTETTSSIDLLLAARTFAAQHGVVLKRDVLVTGFSQGGRASVALGRELSRGAAGSFRVGEIRAVAGPYDLLGSEFPASFDGRLLPSTATFYLAYLVTAWNERLRLYDDPRVAFQAKYAKTVPALFDGTHGEDEIRQGLPGFAVEAVHTGVPEAHPAPDRSPPPGSPRSRPSLRLDPTSAGPPLQRHEGHRRDCGEHHCLRSCTEAARCRRDRPRPGSGRPHRHCLRRLPRDHPHLQQMGLT
ncbi:hypothetical protein AB0E69_22465 [Kribbella sp. NPDC026611]|uniref:alpha/beta hydrolase family protein n=1 Tax=Kribbella sp. NPDC026611 TaxID=3154911 RepID=UPI00340E0F0C